MNINKNEIKCNVLGAADQKAQIEIEAQLNATTPEHIREILKDQGVDLRTLRSAPKKHIAESKERTKKATPKKDDEPLGQPCTDPSTALIYGKTTRKIASLEEIFDGLRAKVEKLRDQRRELAEQLRKTDDLLAYISMRCDIITETAEGTEKKDPADCLTYIGET
ncbi:MAG TPA: hypothetical protein PLY43_05315, partial [Ruminococcus sp.]|nr:hypothetical protein [Ruminococcus sp.]